MVRGVVLGVVITVLTSWCLAIEYAPVIETDKGPVRGLKEYTAWEHVPYFSYKGIPYAEPPVGELRFRPPVEVKPWNATLDAFEEGNVCPQYDFVFSNLTGDEDCLFINVHVPQTGESNLPTLVFIYGGSFKSGYGNSFLYGPDFFIEQGVAVVTFNYRLGALGFLALSHPKALGNCGLKDQRMVLQWVNKNIAKFGGDPEKVTLGGQSAGAVSVDFQILSEKNAGLFGKAIVQSGSVFVPYGYHPPEIIEERSFRLGSTLGFETSDKDKLLEFLLKVPAFRIIEATKSVTFVDLPFTPTMEDPSVAPEEEHIITECPVEKYKSGKYNKLPHLRGFMHDESLAFLKGPADLLSMVSNDLSVVKDGVSSTSMLGAGSWVRLITNLIQNASDFTLDELVSITTDLLFKSEIDVTQKFMSQTNDHPIYYYDVTFKSKYSLHETWYKINVPGSAHGNDIGYSFYYDIPNVVVPKDPNHPYNKFRKTWVRLLSNFVKYGNPTPDGRNDPLLNVTWTDSRKDGRQLRIDRTLKMVDRQIDKTAALFEVFVRLIAPLYTGCKLLLPTLIRSLWTVW